MRLGKQAKAIESLGDKLLAVDTEGEQVQTKTRIYHLVINFLQFNELCKGRNKLVTRIESEYVRLKCLLDKGIENI